MTSPCEFILAKIHQYNVLDIQMELTSDTGTWIIKYLDSATEEEKTQAQAVISTIDYAIIETILPQIESLENSITARRRDEAIIGVDNGWLKNIRDQITNLRNQL